MAISGRELLLKTFKFVDIAVLGFSFVVSHMIVSSGGMDLSSPSLISLRIKHLLLLAILAFIWHLTFSSAGLYQTRRLGSIYREFADIAKCTSLGSLAMLVSGFVFNIDLFSSTFIVVFWLSTSLLMMMGRIMLRSVLAGFRRRGMNRRNIVIVGTAQRSLRFARAVEAHKYLGYKVIGFVDDQWYYNEGEDKRWQLLGSLSELPKVLNDHVVDEVAISLPVKSYYNQIESIIRHCEEQGIVVRLLTDMFTVSLAKSHLSMVDDIPVLTLYSAPYEDYQMALKRTFDLVMSVVLLAVLSPLFVIVTILIKVTSGNPIFFVQERVGYNKRIFKAAKFRTMVRDAESLRSSLEDFNVMKGPTFKIKNDPRVTRLGRYLRKTSIDELPQLFSILKGDMSLVGPRPLPVRDYEGFDAAWQKRRFSMKPGLTCFWQVGGRNNIGFDRWMQLDMEYIDNWSLWLDLKILYRTIPAILTCKGAM